MGDSYIIDTACTNFIDVIGLELKINCTKTWRKPSSSVFYMMDLLIHGKQNCLLLVF